MFEVSAYKLGLFFFCIVTVSSFLLQQDHSAHIGPGKDSNTNHPSLGFSHNETGFNTTAMQISSFFNYINSASVFFRDDTKACLEYISDQMNKTYGVNGYGFSIIQQGNGNYSDTTIHTSTYAYAVLAAGVDKVFPNKSYMFHLEPISSGRLYKVYIYYPAQKGSGINQTLQTVIKNIILSVETTSTCQCQRGSTENIAGYLNDYEGGFWNVYCSNATIYMSVYPQKDMYAQAKPKNCYYALYRV